MTRSKKIISSIIMISDRQLRSRYLEGGEPPLEFIPVHRRIVCLCGEVQVWPVSCSQWWSLKYVNVGKGDDLMVIQLMVMFKVNKDGVVDLSVMLMVADLRPLIPQCLAAPQTGFHGYVTICSVDVLFTPTNPFRPQIFLWKSCLCKYNQDPSRLCLKKGLTSICESSLVAKYFPSLDSQPRWPFLQYFIKFSLSCLNKKKSSVHRERWYRHSSACSL